MARRSPLNARYQKNTGPAGKTRKSASSAKIKRAESAKKAAPKQKRRLFPEIPTTPEMKRWRRIWWALIIVALLFASSVLIPGLKSNESVIKIALAIEFSALAVAVWIDWRKIRPLRNQAIEDAKKARKEK